MQDQGRGRPQPLHCSLCERVVQRANKHHIVPKSEGGQATVILCLTCHKTLHQFFTNRTLAQSLNSIEALRQDPDVARYLAWIQRKPDQVFRVARKRLKR